MPNSIADLAETPGVGQLKTWSRTIQEDLALWPSTLEPGVAVELHRDGPGPPCMVSDREGCRERIGGRPVPTRMIAASVTVSELWTFPVLFVGGGLWAAHCHVLLLFEAGLQSPR